MNRAEIFTAFALLWMIYSNTSKGDFAKLFGLSVAGVYAVLAMVFAVTA